MKKQASSRRRGKLIALALVLGLILVGLLAFTLYVQHLAGNINYVDPSTIPSFSLESVEEFFSSLTSDKDSSQSPEEDTTAKGGTVNILLIGQDALEGESRARSDSMILCTFHSKEKKLTLTSFLRDTYVSIPGHGKNRLNAAYAYGGMSLLNETLESNFAVQIDGNVEVDFTQFSKIVDLLGGVELELRQDEADWLNQETGGDLTEGLQLLNGEQALAYARIRKLDADGDFGRTNRQRKIITALLQRWKDASFLTTFSLLEQILPMITTDMSGIEILGYAVTLFPMLSDMEVTSQHIPADGTYSNQNIDGMSVLVPDLEENRQLLRQILEP